MGNNRCQHCRIRTPEFHYAPPATWDTGNTTAEDILRKYLKHGHYIIDSGPAIHRSKFTEVRHAVEYMQDDLNHQRKVVLKIMIVAPNPTQA